MGDSLVTEYDLSTIRRDVLMNQILRATKPQIGRPGPEWFTVGELLEQARKTEPDITLPALYGRLERATEALRLEKFNNGDGRQNYYRLTKGESDPDDDEEDPYKPVSFVDPYAEV